MNATSSTLDGMTNKFVLTRDNVDQKSSVGYHPEHHHCGEAQAGSTETGFSVLHRQIGYSELVAQPRTGLDHGQTRKVHVAGHTLPGSARSAKTPARPQRRLWSWRKIDYSGEQSQRRKEGYGRTCYVSKLKNNKCCVNIVVTIYNLENLNIKSVQIKLGTFLQRMPFMPKLLLGQPVPPDSSIAFFDTYIVTF